MNIKRLRLPGSYEITLSPRADDRGYFMRTFDREILAAAGIGPVWQQENEAFTRQRNTVRGLHFQRPPHAETKLIRAVAGAVLDVFVDLRRGSPTFGQWDCVELSAERRNMVLVPRGCAHGYCTLTDNSLVAYKVDNAYAPAHEGGLRWNDPAIGIKWPVTDPILSPRDEAQPLLSEIAPLDESWPADWPDGARE